MSLQMTMMIDPPRDREDVFRNRDQDRDRVQVEPEESKPGLMDELTDAFFHVNRYEKDDEDD